MWLIFITLFSTYLRTDQVFVDALGPSKVWEAKLSAQFPGISFTVTPKADSKFVVVGAASVAAKVTRDAWIEGWVFEEARSSEDGDNSEGDKEKEVLWEGEFGSGYPSGSSVARKSQGLLA